MLPPLPVQALAAVPVGFLRIVGLVLYWLLTRIAATERAKARLWQRQVSKYGPIVSALPLCCLSGRPAAPVELDLGLPLHLKQRWRVPLTHLFWIACLPNA